VFDAPADGAGDGLYQFFLQFKQVFQGRIVTLAPDLVTGRGIAQLNRDADVVTEFANTALDDIANTELDADFLNALAAVAVDDAGMSRFDIEDAERTQADNDAVADTIAEVFLLGIAGQVLKGSTSIVG